MIKKIAVVLAIIFTVSGCGPYKQNDPPPFQRPPIDQHDKDKNIQDKLYVDEEPSVKPIPFEIGKEVDYKPMGCTPDVDC